ncbi:MAG: hypothetical protein EPO21_20940 [Chloroflexota bacterium]|nr:MAG: hypothetical protein EPO21_20940 [Chloroflexota bacterium]
MKRCVYIILLALSLAVVVSCDTNEQPTPDPKAGVAAATARPTVQSTVTPVTEASNRQPMQSPKAGGAATIARPTVQSTATSAAGDGWVTYRDAADRFEFRYPEACRVTKQGVVIGVGSRIELTTADSAGSNLDAFVNKFLDDKVRTSSWTIESRKAGNVAGKESITAEYRFGGPNRFGTAAFVQRDRTIYIWNLTAGAFTCDEARVYAPVVASLRFAD